MAEFQYTKQAAAGEALPDGLTPLEQQTFQAIRFLYALYKTGKIQRDQAKEEKKKIMAAYNKALDAERLRTKMMEERVSQMWHDIKSAVVKYGVESESGAVFSIPGIEVIEDPFVDAEEDDGGGDD